MTSVASLGRSIAPLIAPAESGIAVLPGTSTVLPTKFAAVAMRFCEIWVDTPVSVVLSWVMPVTVENCAICAII